jgi:Ca2+-binding RTX toxin-like protein
VSPVVISRRAWARGGMVALALVVCAGVIAPAALGGSAARSDREQLAAKLMRRDPGALVNGNTQVATKAGEHLFGAPHRINFMVALGPNERLDGGASDDQLGARADGAARIEGNRGNDLIRGWHRDGLLAGGRGDDLIYGGSGRDRLSGGPGDDRLVDGNGDATIRPGGGENEVQVADGDGDDRVLCEPGADDRIKADPGDDLANTCDRQSSSAGHRQSPTASPAARAAKRAVTGSGTNDDPYVAAVDDINATTSAVNGFPARSITGFWKSESVPAYQCPFSHPWLRDINYAPFGTTVPHGVEVRNLGPVGVYMTLGAVSADNGDRVTGTITRSKGLVSVSLASATNWKGGTQSYRVVLHCTRDFTYGYYDRWN